MSWTLGELAVRFGCELRGDPGLRVDHIAGLSGAGPGGLSFLVNPKLKSDLRSTRATAVVLAARTLEDCPVAALIDPNPHAAFARMAELLHPTPRPQPGVHPSAVVHPEAEIDPSAEIGALCVIERDVRVGAQCLIGPGCLLAAGVRVGDATRLVGRVTLERSVQLGARVLVHPGAVIGADGFGLARDGGRWLKVPQIGAVRIGDDVEIGANTTIDRGAIEDTVIGEGVKLDNQIQIGHNVRIGAHTAIAGCTAIAGSTQIGERCMIGGAAIIAGHLEICDDAVITGSTTVSRSIREPGVYSSGLPIEPQQRWRRLVAHLHRVAAGRAGHSASPAPEQDTNDD